MKTNKTFFAYSIVSLLIAFLTMRGTVQEYIHFSSIEGEMGFAFLSLMMGVICLFCTFEKEKC